MDFSTAPLRSRPSAATILAPLQRALRFLRAHKIATAVVLVAVVSFYWYEVRPIVIARQCSSQASMDARLLVRSKAELAKEKDARASYAELAKKNMYLRNDYDSFLQKCLLHYGFLLVKISGDPTAEASSAAKMVQK